MFKKKSNLPVRPKYPSTNHIIDDLTAATGDGGQFLDTAKTINSEGSKTSESQMQDAGYQTIKSVLHHSQELQKAMKELKDICENLQECRAEITEISNELKEKALNALL